MESFLDLLSFYEKSLEAKGFYSHFHQKKQLTPENYNPLNFLLPPYSSSQIEISIEAKKGDLRFDMPMLIGSINPSQKIMIIGMEPRHTNDHFNLMRLNNRVFATPFGIDRWYSKSNKGIYASAFKPYLTEERLFLFTDFVKEYEIISLEEKGLSDAHARQHFQSKFENNYQTILEEEIALFQPDLIIALGIKDVSQKIPAAWLAKYNVKVIHHPISGNFRRMQNSMNNLLT